MNGKVKLCKKVSPTSRAIYSQKPNPQVLPSCLLITEQIKQDIWPITSPSPSPVRLENISHYYRLDLERP